MKHVFRTTGKYWAQEDGFGFVFGLAGMAGFYWIGSNWLAALMGVMALLGIMGIRRLLRARLEIDELSLVLFSNNEPLVIRWEDVRVAKLIESYHKPRKILLLDCTDAEDGQVWEITLDWYDHQRIWQLAQQYLSSVSLAEDAQRRTPEYQAWEAAVVAETNELALPLRASDNWLIKITIWVVTIFLIGAACVFAVSPGLEQKLLALFLLGFAAFSAYCSLMVGNIEADLESIRLKTLFGAYQIRWDEVTAVESDIYGSLVFYGKNKHLGITSPVYWSGHNKELLAGFLVAQIELRRIPLKRIRVSFKFAKNTKVR